MESNSYIGFMKSRNKSASHNIPGDVLDYIEDEFSSGVPEPMGDLLRRAFGLMAPAPTPKSAFSHKSSSVLLTDVSDLDVGGEKLIKRRTKKDGSWSSNQRAVSKAIEKYEQETGKKFRLYADDGDIMVVRDR